MRGLDALGQMLGKKTAEHEELMVERVRDAASVCAAALCLPKRARSILYQQASHRIVYYERRNRLRADLGGPDRN